MCGFTGFLSKDMQARDMAEILGRMSAPLTHRGPDGHGVWMDAPAGIGLAHRRLAVIDLSEHAKQPMESSCGRYVLAYNGEIYNFRTLRADLESSGAVFAGTGDTEVLLFAVSKWGLKKALAKCNGMFALALWDKKERVLSFARDRMGKKPLYYGRAGNDLVFASELSALCAHPGFTREIDRSALALFLRYSYVPAPFSIYAGVYKLMPGTVLEVSFDDIDKRTGVDALNRRADPFWSARGIAEKGVQMPFDGSMEEAEQALHDLLYDAVGSRMISDVPLGALLSGGIDSSTVVSMMQAQSPRPIKTFTIGFSNPTMNEANHAAAVARHLGTDHTELYVTTENLLDVVPDMPKIYDEPFADSSQVPTFLVSRLARENVTVALTGDGGDELFCGYRRYFRGAKIWKANRSIPRPVRICAAGALKALSWSPEGRLAAHAQDIMAESIVDTYVKRISAVNAPERLLIAGRESVPGYVRDALDASLPDPVSCMMFADMINYLTDDLLAKVDRAAMAVSLELRNPILDHRVVELAWRLPLWMKTDGKTGKIILKKVLDRYVPREITDRPKKGFGAPTFDWLAGPLRGWAESLLSEDALAAEGLFAPGRIRALWSDLLVKKRKNHHILWNVLMFRAWNEHQADRAARG
ncbi:MAG: asparagine synthase (glutamine-hydrolyzing) [Deltaproteobacteria bacterium]|nr:asparagine synthase (glutamine-hydrolyzing) [Deltaproteobacteria bacterium]